MKKNSSVSSPVRGIALGGVLTALALVFSYVELLIPFSLGIPGVKPGFANIVIVYALYRLGPRYAVLVNLCRILLSGLLFGSVFSVLYALSGGMLSLLGMILLCRTQAFSITGVSMTGGVLHNLGQLLAAALVVRTPQVFLYFPVLVFSGIAAGIVTGILATLCLRKTQVLEKTKGQRIK